MWINDSPHVLILMPCDSTIPHNLSLLNEARGRRQTTDGLEIASNQLNSWGPTCLWDRLPMEARQGFARQR